MEQEQVYTGKISFVNIGRGYGFISQPDNTSIFFHMSNVGGIEFADLKKEMEVEYLIKETKKGHEAYGVLVKNE